MLVYDVANRDSFLSLAKWLQQVRANCGSQAAVLLVANKTDLAESTWQVTRGEAQRFASDNGLALLEASALDGHNVQAAFERVILGLSFDPIGDFCFFLLKNNLMLNQFRCAPHAHKIRDGKDGRAESCRRRSDRHRSMMRHTIEIDF